MLGFLLTDENLVLKKYVLELLRTNMSTLQGVLRTQHSVDILPFVLKLLSGSVQVLVQRTHGGRGTRHSQRFIPYGVRVRVIPLDYD
jgi:hypothetical protein